MVLAAYLICQRKVLPACIAGLVYLVHMFLDLAGSAGPDGSIWTIYPFWPFSRYEVGVDWQWPLNSWQNTLITAVFLVITIIIAAKKKRTFLEIFSTRLDRYCIGVFERLLGKKDVQ